MEKVLDDIKKYELMVFGFLIFIGAIFMAVKIIRNNMKAKEEQAKNTPEKCFD